MGQHHHNGASLPYSHILLTLLHLDHTNTTNFSYLACDKYEIHGSRNIFGRGDTKISGIEGSEVVDSVGEFHGSR